MGEGEGLGRSKIPSFAGNRGGPCLSEEQTSLRVVHVCVSSCVYDGVGAWVWVGDKGQRRCVWCACFASSRDVFPGHKPPSSFAPLAPTSCSRWEKEGKMHRPFSSRSCGRNHHL